MLKSKNPCGFVIPALKVSVTNPRGFFDLSNFYLIKLISEPLTLRPLWGSRLRLLGKWRWLLGYWTIGLSKTALHEKTFLNWRPLVDKFILVCIPGKLRWSSSRDLWHFLTLWHSEAHTTLLTGPHCNTGSWDVNKTFFYSTLGWIIYFCITMLSFHNLAWHTNYFTTPFTHTLSTALPSL